MSGLRANLRQFALLVLVNALVGAMIGLERSVLPPWAAARFGLEATGAILSFIAVFGVSKALTNLLAGQLSDAVGRKPVLVAGWILALPVPLLLMAAPSWGWVLAANALLGLSQGLSWSTAVIMKIDLAGPKDRGLAMGLNEFAGYFAVAISALLTGALSERFGLRAEIFGVGVPVALLGLGLSVARVRETLPLAGAGPGPGGRGVFWRASVSDPALSSATWAGFVNNLNDGMAWGLFPLIFAAAGAGLGQIGWLAALYPAVWGLAQLLTGALSDSIGRKGLIAWGMVVQAAGLGVVAVGHSVPAFALGQVLLGLGTAMVYPTLLAAVGDAAEPAWRARAVGVYRLWRDLGYAAGALVAGGLADAFGPAAAVWAVAALTLAAGGLVAVRMPGGLTPPRGG